MLRFSFFFSACLSASSAVLAVSPQHDDYYSDDIFTAIQEARHRTHHYNYSRAKRYNRTTSQSIQIPRLLNKEMDTHVVTGAMEATAAGQPQTPGVEETLTQANLGRNIKKDDAKQPDSEQNTPRFNASSGPTVIREIRYRGADFDGAARNIRSDVSVSASVRP